MNVVFTEQAWDEYTQWQDEGIDISSKINDLIKSIQRDPFKGLGKPEPLKYQLKGYWSRRIAQDHRLVYAVEGTKGIDQRVTIVQCKYHYNK